MRNIMKPAATASSRTRRSVRGVAAVVASLALAAGLGSYPVDAQEGVEVTAQTEAPVNPSVSTYPVSVPAEPAPNALVTNVRSSIARVTGAQQATEATKAPSADRSAVTWTREDDTDYITVNDPEGEAWEFGGKASDEDIFALKRGGKGEVTDVISITADGRRLESYDYGYFNSAEGSFVAFNLNALHTIPPQVVEIEARATGVGEYSIAESDEVPTAGQLEASGYGEGRGADSDEATDFRAAPPGQFPNHPGVYDQEFLLSKPEVSWVNGNPEIKAKVHESGNWQVTRFAIKKDRDDSNTKDIAGPVRVRVIRDGNQVIEGNFNFAGRNQRVWQRNALGKSFDTEFYLYPEVTDLVIKGGDTIIFNPVGPPSGTYDLQVWGQRQPSDPEQPSPSDKNRFAVEGQGGIELEPAKTTQVATKPLTFKTTSTVENDAKFSRAVMRVNAPNSILAIEKYNIEADKFEPGVTFGRRVISQSKDYVEFEVFPLKDGERVESVNMPKGATFTMTTSFSDNPSRIDSVATIYGTASVKPEQPTTTVPPPTGDKWVHGKVPNPPMPKKCGLKVAIVADQSHSLYHADVNGFHATRNAAMEMVTALKNAPETKVGVYTFGTTTGNGGTTGKAVPVGDGNGGVNSVITEAIKKWDRPRDGSATNWEAGLAQVASEKYDVVYFITDGMPTFDMDPWQNGPDGKPLSNSGGYVQERSLNRAIDQANKLKAAGTRIVPIMVDLTMLGGNVITEDYVLKNILPSSAPVDKAPIGTPVFLHTGTHRTNGEILFPEYARTLYKNPGKDPLIVNAKEAVDAPKNTLSGKSRHLMGFYKKTATGVGTDLTDRDKDLWTHGIRTVKQMGEDISGPGDTIHLSEYSELTTYLQQIGEDLSRLCKGKIIVKKQIVDSQGEPYLQPQQYVEGWDFSLFTSESVIEAEQGVTVSSDTKQTKNKGQTKAADASWNLLTDKPVTATITELQKETFTLHRQDGKNAVCKQLLNGEESPVEVQNVGENGFTVPVNASGPSIATVTCVVSNTPKEESKYGLELRKVDHDDRTVTLDGARFVVRFKDGDASKEMELIPGQNGVHTIDKILKQRVEYELVEVQSPTMDGVTYSLLAAPIRFRGTVTDGTVNIEYKVGESWVNDLSAQGVWNIEPASSESNKTIAHLEIANVRQGDLPKTGGAGLQLPILLGGALIAAGALVGRRKVAA